MCRTVWWSSRNVEARDQLTITENWNLKIRPREAQDGYITPEMVQIDDNAVQLGSCTKFVTCNRCTTSSSQMSVGNFVLGGRSNDFQFDSKFYRESRACTYIFVIYIRNVGHESCCSVDDQNKNISAVSTWQAREVR